MSVPKLLLEKGRVVYLHELRVINDGPLRDVAISLSPVGHKPLPLVFVGENGSGKTNLLSLIADAIMEGAAQHHDDVLPFSRGPSRSWLRIVGGDTIRRGSTGAVALLRFEHAGTSYIYKQKSGTLQESDRPSDLSESLRPAWTWPNEENIKEFPIPLDAGRSIYTDGCYAYFPASRSEAPHWLNVESIRTSPFQVQPKFGGRLGRSMYVEQAVHDVGDWISRLIMDSRPNLREITVGEKVHLAPETYDFQGHRTTREFVDQILQEIIDDPEARFIWRSRFSGLEFFSPRRQAILPLRALSSGQSTLISVFGTMAMHCDTTTQGAPSNGMGICIIDEIDAHVHIELAFRVIPRLIRLLPRIQFIISAHSPLFVLGMQAEFGDDGFELVELPSGRSISAEGYAEFRTALDVLQGTQSFDALVAERVQAASGPLVLCEGETDPRYLVAAAELLDRRHLLEGITIDWVGKRDTKSGGSIVAGKDNLDRAWKLLTENSELALRPTLLLYDNDTRRKDDQQGSTFIRVMPTNPSNQHIRKGVENLLPERVFVEDMYRTSMKDDGNGKRVTVTELDKTRLCAHLCDNVREPSDFAGIVPLLDVLSAWRREIGLDAVGGEPDHAEPEVVIMQPGQSQSGTELSDQAP